jgi:hypothetical protein
VNVLLPDRVTLPTPFFTSPPAPLTVPVSRVSPTGSFSVSVEPLRFTAPTVNARPSFSHCWLPPSVTGAVMVVLLPVSACTPPAPIVKALPAMLATGALKVMDWNAVPAGRSFVVARLAAPAWNTRSSPATGAMPPQLEPTLQALLVVPVQARMAPKALSESSVARTATKVIRLIKR